MRLVSLLLGAAMLFFTAASHQLGATMEGQTLALHPDTQAFLQLGQQLEAEHKYRMEMNAQSAAEFQPKPGFRIKNMGEFLEGVNRAHPLDDDEVIDVVFLRSTLQKSQAWYIRWVYAFFNANHGGLGFIRRSTGKEPDEDGGGVVVELYGEHGFTAVAIPQIKKKSGETLPQDIDDTVDRTADPDAGQVGPDGRPLLPRDRLAGATLEWTNTIVVNVMNKVDMAYWDEQIHVGTISGRELRLLDCWIPQWMHAFPYYQLWAVTAPNSAGKTLVESHTCWDFIMDIMAYLHANMHEGSSWNTEAVAKLKKSNTKVTTGGALVPVKWADADEHKRRQIVEYYALSFANKVMGAHLDRTQRTAFVYDKNVDTYYEVPQVAPFYSYSWETVDWSLHPPMFFDEVCPAPNYATKFNVVPTGSSEKVASKAQREAEAARVAYEESVRSAKEMESEEQFNRFMHALVQINKPMPLIQPATGRFALGGNRYKSSVIGGGMLKLGGEAEQAGAKKKEVRQHALDVAIEEID